MRCEAFAQLWQGLLLEVFGKQVKQGTANESQVGQQRGVTGAGAIFTHQDIASPVIADFHPAPVSSDQGQPLLGLIMLGGHTGEVVTGLGGRGPGFLDRALAAQDDQSSGKGEVGGGGLEREGMEMAHFDASPARLGVGKKGVSFRASNPWARLSRLGWLPLIWSR